MEQQAVRHHNDADEAPPIAPSPPFPPYPPFPPFPPYPPYPPTIVICPPQAYTGFHQQCRCNTAVGSHGAPGQITGSTSTQANPLPMFLPLGAASTGSTQTAPAQTTAAASPQGMTATSTAAPTVGSVILDVAKALFPVIDTIIKAATSGGKKDEPKPT
jgi:hypothetical protein